MIEAARAVLVGCMCRHLIAIAITTTLFVANHQDRVTIFGGLVAYIYIYISIIQFIQNALCVYIYTHINFFVS